MAEQVIGSPGRRHLGPAVARKSSLQGIAPAFRRPGQDLGFSPEGVEMKSGMGVRMTVPTLRRDDGSSMDGSAVGHYTPWVSPLTCMAEGGQQSEIGRDSRGEACSILRELARPYCKVASIVKVSTGARFLGVSAQDSASFPGKPMYRYSAILGGGTPPSAHRSLGPMR